jgi:hypothetical protein
MGLRSSAVKDPNGFKKKSKAIICCQQVEWAR